MKFAIATVAYHEERLIKYFVRHYKPLVDEILVLNSTVPWQGDLEGYDNTGDIAKALGARVIKDNWRTEEEQRNEGIRQLEHFDWVFILDPDEYILKDDFEKFKQWLEDAEYDTYKCRMITYWKNGYVIIPHDSHQPIVAVRPRLSLFSDKRGVSCDILEAPFQIHHFSWARTDEEVYRKVTHFAHAHEFNGVNWYKEKWLKWTPEVENLHPVNPEKWKKAVRFEIPKELEHLLFNL